MTPNAPISTIAHAIQLAVAPVFLLTGVAAILSVFTTRLGRIVDRARVLHARRLVEGTPEGEELQAELAVLARRTVVVNVAITFCTLGALLICLVVAVIFAGSFVSMRVATPIALCFVGAMICLICALLSFLVEIYMATAQTQVQR